MSLTPADLPQEVAAILEHRAAESPERVFFLMSDVTETFGSCNEKANRFAHGLSRLGVGQRDMVALMMPNIPEHLTARFAVNKLGAIEVSINATFRGPGLVHMLNLCEAQVLVVDESYLDQVTEIADALVSLKTVIVRGESPASIHTLGWSLVAFDEVPSSDTTNPARQVDGHDTAMVLYTSGTTGPSKGCVFPHRWMIHTAEVMCEYYRITAEDTIYTAFPLFHSNATVCAVMPALLSGGRAAIGKRFSASRHWDEIRRFGATIMDFMGATLAILWKNPPQPNDADNPVRVAWGVPRPEFADGFEKRFGLQVVEVYGLTDVGLIAMCPLNEPHRPGACGKPVESSYEVKIFDDHDHALSTGERGEIVVRPQQPSVMLDGYLKMPEATLNTLRNLWFHTGDIGFMDEAGYLHFVERKKDSIRRRGQNISAFELEEAVNLHPTVLESAAIGVPSALTEEDVMLWVVPQPGQSLSPEELIEHCETNVARHMVPRYVEIVDDLPRTPTEKVEKYRLKEIGVRATTWDREAEGNR